MDECTDILQVMVITRVKSRDPYISPPYVPRAGQIPSLRRGLIEKVFTM
jgi:hypothetical protein